MKTRLTRDEVNAIRCWECGAQVYGLTRREAFMGWLCGSWRESLLDRLFNYYYGDLQSVLWEDMQEGLPIDWCAKCELEFLGLNEADGRAYQEPAHLEGERKHCAVCKLPLSKNHVCFDDMQEDIPF